MKIHCICQSLFCKNKVKKFYRLLPEKRTFIVFIWTVSIRLRLSESVFKHAIKMYIKVKNVEIKGENRQYHFIVGQKLT
jgi:hypothetical protein